MTIIWFCREKTRNCSDSFWKICLYVLFFIVNLLNCLYFIIIMVCLDYHRVYVKNFMNKINYDLEKQKNDYKWSVAVLMHYIFAAFYIVIYFTLKKNFEFEDINYYKIPSTNRDININYQFTHPNEQNGKLNNEEIANLKNQINDLKGEINTITTDRDKYKIKYEQISGNNTNLNINEDDQKLIAVLKETITKNNEKISRLEDTNKSLLDMVNENKDAKDILKSILPFSIVKGEKLMTVVFTDGGQNFKRPIICKNTQKFNEVENLFNEIMPEYKETENYFLAGGTIINKSKTLEENKIKDGQ